MSQGSPTILQRIITESRHYFIFAGVFSLFINLLMLTLPIYMLQVFDRVLTSQSNETLVMLSLVAIFALFIMLILDAIRSRIMLGAAISLDNKIGPLVVDGLLRRAAQPASSANPFTAGLRDVAALRSFLCGPSVIAIFDTPWVPIFVAVIFLFHPWLGMAAVMAAVIIFALGVVNEKSTRRPLEAMSRQTGIAARFIDSSLRNAEVISALGMGKRTIARWQTLNEEVSECQLQSGLRGGAIGGITKFFRMVVQIIMLALGAYLVIEAHLSSGVMMAATLLLARALAPVEASITTWKNFVDARESWHRLQELLAQPVTVAATVDLPALQGRLDLERITFAIPGTDRMIIKGVQLSLAPGEAMGVIGPSASGKSTLARLIAGIWRPSSGAVRMDGADVSTWPREQLGNQIGYLPQDVELFSGTVAENIARWGEINSDAVVEAAQRACAHEMIVRLPKAYDTPIAEGGAILSGGQRQRVALARAVYGNPKLIILDEPNASLDTAGEEALAEAIRTMKADGVTLVIISHRPSVLANVDKLLVMRDGQMELFGPRNEVMAKVTARPAPTGDTPHLVAASRQQ